MNILKKALILLLIFVILPFPSPSLAITDDFYGTYYFASVGSTSTSTVIDHYTAGDHDALTRIYFKDISAYPNIQTMTSVVRNESQLTYSAGEFKHNGTLNIGGVTIGNYSYWGHSTGGDYVFLQMGISDWDITGYSGEQEVIIGVGEDGQYVKDFGDKISKSVRLNESTDWGFGEASPNNVITNAPGKANNIHYTKDFSQSYTFSEVGDLTRLFYNKNDQSSNISIYLDDDLIYQELNPSQTNLTLEWVSSWLDSNYDEITINVWDALGYPYSRTHNFAPSPPPDDGVLNTLSGTIKDAKTNAIIPSNPINLSTATGYGGSYSTTSTGAGAYSITNIIDDIYYIQANRSGYENYTFEKNITSNTEHIIYMVENITLDANKSGVYGTVTNYYNATGVPTTWMKISNDTWYQITYTNQNGYYEFLNFAPGNYTIQAQKTGYFPYEAALTFTSNELKYVPIELVSEEIPPDPTPTPTPPVTNILTPFRAIIASFGISESLGGALIALFIIIIMGALFARAGTIAAIGGMFFGFIISIAMSLLPAYLLTITIIVVILLILRIRGDL